MLHAGHLPTTHMLQRVRSVSALTIVSAIALLAAACGGSATLAEAPVTAEPSVVAEAPVAVDAAATPPAVEGTPTPPPSQSEPTILDAAFLEGLLEPERVADGALLVVSIDADGATSHASKGVDIEGNAPLATDPFRVGSVTKIFTSLLVMSLVDDGAVDLDAPAADYVTRVPVPADITVRQLLMQRSGILNYTQPREFFAEVLADPARVWSPEDVWETIADDPTVSDPDLRFSYSNTNYLVLGVLLEEVTGQTYHDLLRNRITGPLELSATYVAGFDVGPEPFDPFSLTTANELDYTSIATSAWSAGAIVSSAPDMHTLFTAMFDGGIISDEALAEMTTGNEYGFGLQLEDWSRGITGHNGGIPGYITFARHAPEAGITVFAVTTERTPTQGITESLLDAMADYQDS